MEMPEGFKEFEETYKDRSWFEVPTPKIIIAMNLMREMAEALEMINDGYHTNIQECMNYAKPVLKKWQEWK